MTTHDEAADLPLSCLSITICDYLSKGLTASVMFTVVVTTCTEAAAADSIEQFRARLLACNYLQQILTG